MAIDKGQDSARTETYRWGPVLTSRHARGRMTGGDDAFVVDEPAYAMQEAAGQVSVEWKVTKQSRYYQYPGGFAEWLAKYVFGIRSSRTPSQWCLRLCSPSVLSILIRKTSILCFQGFPATYPEKATCWPRWGTTGVGGGAVRTPYPQSNMPRRNLPGTTLCPNCTTSNFRCIFLSTVSFYFRKTSMHFKKGMPM